MFPSIFILDFSSVAFLICRMSLILIKMSDNLMTVAKNNLFGILYLYSFILITVYYICNLKQCKASAASERHMFHFSTSVHHVAHTGSIVSVWWEEKWNLLEDNLSTRRSWWGCLCGGDNDVLQDTAVCGNIKALRIEWSKSISFLSVRCGEERDGQKYKAGEREKQHKELYSVFLWVHTCG